MILDKNIFMATTKAIKDTYDLNTRISKNLEDLVEGFPFLKNTEILNNAIIKLVEELYGNDLYSYWIYELNFGKKGKEYKISKNGKIIDISTINRLYNYLESEEWNSVATEETKGDI